MKNIGVVAKKIKQTESAGKGAAIQGLGVLLCILAFFAGTIGLFLLLPAGLILLIAGSFAAHAWKCSECRGKVDKRARVCPHCRAEF